MTRDTFDMFQKPDRGRFGENECGNESIRGNESVRSNLIDLAMVIHVDRPASVLASTGDITRAVWLPKSQIEITDTGPLERKKNGRIAQPCQIAMPKWLAKEKELI